ncbi:MAG: response regulator transcription factor [Rhodanobacteraceae bacterium]|jgi:two-component system LytT family response regulator|nr:response regulator transcription factor [Rhodanobacteraceae bacterium]
MLALIVEDEPIAARTLRQLIADLAPDLDVEGPLPSIAAATARLAEGPVPDLVFMDVQLADGLCFEIFEAMPLALPVIFTTAYDAFALKAFEVFGIDYLLKPIKPERFALALAKWRRLRVAGQAAPAPASGLAQAYFRSAQQYRARFLVQQGEHLQSIAVEDIAYFHKDLVVRLVTRAGRRYTVSPSLDELEQALDPAQFFRVNRQVLARVQAIVRATRQFKGKLEVELDPALPEPVVVSQERAAAFRDWLDR